MTSPDYDIEADREPSSFSIVWWDRLCHVELQVSETLYNVVCGGFLYKSSAVRREQKALSTHESSFWRLTFNVDRDKLEELIDDLAKDRIWLMPDFCSGNVAQIINRYFPEYHVPFWQARTPIKLIGHLAPKATEKTRYSVDPVAESIVTTEARSIECVVALGMAAVIVIPLSLMTFGSLTAVAVYGDDLDV